jgi:hypothetical protein
MEKKEMITKTYAHHKPTKEDLAKIETIRTGFSNLDGILKMLAPGSKELSVALNHLETAQMWANKAIVINNPASEVQASTLEVTG